MKKLLLILVIALAFVGCKKGNSDISVSFEVVAPTLPDGTSLSGELTLIFENQSYTVNIGERYTLPGVVKAGTYSYYLYNQADGSTMSYDSSSDQVDATVSTISGGEGINPNPDYLFFVSQSVTINSDTQDVIYVTLDPIIRELRFELELDGDAAEQLIEISASLDGVAQQWDCVGEAPSGSSATLYTTFTKDADSNMIYGSVDILGIMSGETQTLTLELSYQDGNPTSHTILSDITSLVDDFNDDKSSAMVLTGSLEIPTGVALGGSIVDWSEVYKNVGVY